MRVNRRHFLKTSLIGSAMVAVGNELAATPAISLQGKDERDLTTNATLRLSFQEGIAPGETLHQKLDFMEQHGIEGFEPGGKGLKRRVKEIKEALRGRKIKMSAICAGFEGFLLASDPAIHKKCRDTMNEIMIAAGELEAVGIVIVPVFTRQTPAMPHTQETRDYLCEQLQEMGDFARQQGTTIILEPLNRKEAFYLRQVSDAASICRDINNPGVRCMGDLWHMTWEETSDRAAFLSAADYLQHIHIASRKRRVMPGEDGAADNYVDAFKGLKMVGYDKYVSFECGCDGDRAVVLPAAIELLRKQWKEA